MSLILKIELGQTSMQVVDYEIHLGMDFIVDGF